MRLSVSDIESYATCPRKWWLTSREGYGLSKPTTNKNIIVGNQFHRACAEWRRQGQPDNILDSVTIDHDDPLEDEAWPLTFAILTGYQKWACNQPSMKYICIEDKLELTLHRHTFVFQMDGLAEDEGRRLWVMEYKTTSQPERLLEQIELDLQPRAYAWAASKLLGRPVNGVIYDVARRTNPWDVPLLKRGGPSRSQETLKGTTSEIYADVIRQAGLELDDFTSELEFIRAREAQGLGLFRRKYLFIGPEAQAQVPKHLHAWARRMENDAHDFPLPILSRYQCAGLCPVWAICSMIEDGLEWQDALAGFDQRTPFSPLTIDL